MARALLDRYAYKTTPAGLLSIARRRRRLWVLTPGNPLREIDPDDVDGTETVEDVFTTEAGSTVMDQPLLSDHNGAWPFAWAEFGAYDLYCPDDPIRPIKRWQAFSGTSLGTGVDDPELAAIAALSSAANRLIRYTGSGTADLVTINQWIVDNVLNVASASAMRTAIAAEASANKTNGALNASASEFPTSGLVKGIIDALDARIDSLESGSAGSEVASNKVNALDDSTSHYPTTHAVTQALAGLGSSAQARVSMSAGDADLNENNLYKAHDSGTGGSGERVLSIPAFAPGTAPSTTDGVWFEARRTNTADFRVRGKAASPVTIETPLSDTPVVAVLISPKFGAASFVQRVADSDLWQCLGYHTLP